MGALQYVQVGLRVTVHNACIYQIQKNAQPTPKK